MYWCHIYDLFLLSDLADLVEIIHKIVQLMENLQERGTLRVCYAFFMLLWVKLRWKSFFSCFHIIRSYCLSHGESKWCKFGRWSHYFFFPWQMESLLKLHFKSLTNIYAIPHSNLISIVN
jgi:hypothetical protein